MIEDFEIQKPVGPFLTEIEANVVRLLAAGYSAKQVAKERKRSYQTIKNQLQVIYRRFGVHNSIQLLNKLGELKGGSKS